MVIVLIAALLPGRVKLEGALGAHAKQLGLETYRPQRAPSLWWR